MKNIQIYPFVKPEHVTDLSIIDMHTFQRLPTESEVERALKSPWMFNVITYQRSGEERAVGYSMAIPLKRIAAEALQQGRMHESEINQSHLAQSFSSASGTYLAAVTSSFRHLPQKPSRIEQTAIRGRLIGLSLGQFIRNSNPVFAIAISPEGISTVREFYGFKEEPYSGPMEGIKNCKPSLFVKLF